ncbi:MAG: hypothetical protein AB7L76_02915 [Burkholderiaceae bacterium]
MNLHHPLIQSLLVPFAVSLIALAVLRALVRRRAALGRTGTPVSAWPPLAAGLGLLASLTAMPGFGNPLSAPEKLPWAMAAAVLAAWLLNLGDAAARRGPALTVAAALLLGFGAWLGGIGATAIAAAALAWLATVAVPALPDRRNAGAAQTAHAARLPAVQAIAALGLAGVSFQAGSALLAQIAAAIAAASAAVALGNWPRGRDRAGFVALLATGVPTGLLAITLWRLTGVSPLPLFILAACGLLQTGAIRRLLPVRWQGSAAEPVAAALAAALLAAAAIAAAGYAPAGDAGGAGPYLN